MTVCPVTPPSTRDEEPLAQHETGERHGGYVVDATNHQLAHVCLIGIGARFRLPPLGTEWTGTCNPSYFASAFVHS